MRWGLALSGPGVVVVAAGAGGGGSPAVGGGGAGPRPLPAENPPSSARLRWGKTSRGCFTSLGPGIPPPHAGTASFSVWAGTGGKS